MAIPHAAPGEVVDVKPLGAALPATRSHALFKSDDLEVIRLVLLAGQSMPEHAVAGGVTVQCIEGRIAFTCKAGEVLLDAGQLVHLAGEEVHGLRALVDASALLTIALDPRALR